MLMRTELESFFDYKLVLKYEVRHTAGKCHRKWHLRSITIIKPKKPRLKKEEKLDYRRNIVGRF